MNLISKPHIKQSAIKVVDRKIVLKKISTSQARFLILYCVTLLIAFNPLKALALLFPPVCLLLLILFVRIGITKKSGIYLLILGAGYFLLGFVYPLSGQEFSIINYIFVLLTYSPVFMLFGNFKPVATLSLLRSMKRITLAVLVFQASLGILQALLAAVQRGEFDGITGDAVQGTIAGLNIFSSLALSNANGQIFIILTITLLICALGVHSQYESKKYLLIVLPVIMVSIVLASVVHLLIFLVLSLLAASGGLILIGKGNLIHKLVVVFVLSGFILIAVALTTKVIPRNLASIPYYLNISPLNPDSLSPKSVATYSTISMLHEVPTLNKWIGVGPGQYSSRASLILSGVYLNQKIPFVQPFETELSKRNIFDPYLRFKISNPSGGSTYFPFYSWLTVLGELGYLGMLFVSGMFMRSFFKMLRRRKPPFPLIGISIATLIIFFFLMGFQDNYWEFSQATLPFFLFVSLLRDYSAS